MKKIISSPLFWLIVAVSLPTAALFHPGLPILHDGQDHVARFANFYSALKDGIIVPRWAANLNWGYGHPILMFLYPLPEYIGSAFHAIGFSLVNSIKLEFGLAFVASAITMFLWMNAVWGPSVGVIGSLLYAFAPYRFLDLYVRGDIGEHVAFVFPPFILYYLFRLAKEKQHLKNTIFAGVATGALILAHNAIALMFLPILALYGLYLLLTEAKEKVVFAISGITALALGFGASAFFWIPAILEGKFTLRDIVTAGEALERFVPWTWFVYSQWNFGGTDQLSKFLGFGQWAGIIALVYFLFRTKEKKLKVFLLSGLVLFLFSLFIMTGASAPLWRAVKFLQVFQFPWRFLAVSEFIAAVVGGIAIGSWVKNNKNLLYIACLLIVLSTAYMWFPKGYQTHDDSFYSGVYPGTTDTGESSPIWSVRFMEHTPANHMDVAQGDATVVEGKRTTISHEYTLNVRKPSLMVENTLYFPGWMIYLNGLPTGIEWQNPDYRGLMTFRVTPGANQSVRVVLEDTKVRRYSEIVSAATLVLIVAGFAGGLVWRRKR